jgi:hypothetical protein
MRNVKLSAAADWTRLSTAALATPARAASLNFLETDTMFLPLSRCRRGIIDCCPCPHAPVAGPRQKRGLSAPSRSGQPRQRRLMAVEAPITTFLPLINAIVGLYGFH